MQLPYFFEENITAGNYILSEATSKHCVQVLRMQAGEQLQLTDGKGNLHTATIIEPHKKNTIVKVDEPVFTKPNDKKITLAVSLLKNASRFEWLLEKATEIGVSAIVPLQCKRTEKQNFKTERMQGIIISAMLQSRQTYLPELFPVTNITSLISSAQQKQKLIAHCMEDEKTPLQTVAMQNEILMLIGPEGDFTDEEIAFALQNNFQPVSLGNTRLRTETAAIVASSLLANL